jgi:hypothetical protein
MDIDEINKGLSQAHENQHWPRMSSRGAWTILTVSISLLIAVTYFMVG